MIIQVLGAGCPTCKKLHELAEQAVKELGLKEKVEYISDIAKLLDMGVMQSPVLAINNKLVVVGFVPDIEKIKELIAKEADSPGVKNLASDYKRKSGGKY